MAGRKRNWRTVECARCGAEIRTTATSLTVLYCPTGTPCSQDRKRERTAEVAAALDALLVCEVPATVNADGYLAWGNVRIHRLVYERYTGRALPKGSTVHHRNGVRTDNDIENLELWARNHPTGVRVADLLEVERQRLAEASVVEDAVHACG